MDILLGIRSWRQAMEAAQTHSLLPCPFASEDVNYINKMMGDLSFVEESQPLQRWHGAKSQLAPLLFSAPLSTEVGQARIVNPFLVPNASLSIYTERIRAEAQFSRENI